LDEFSGNVLTTRYRQACQEQLKFHGKFRLAVDEWGDAGFIGTVGPLRPAAAAVLSVNPDRSG
jgi:hypothetical protein